MPTRSGLTFGFLLAVSLSAKLLASQSEPPADETLFATRIAGFLDRHGFRSQAERRPLGMMVEGWRDNCRLTVRESNVHGTFANVLADLAAPIGPLHYIYRGRVSPTPPKLFPLTEYFIGRELRRIHIPAPRAPVLAVAAAPGCAVTSLPWNEVATFAR